ncbi:hypothetical protein ACHAXS_009854 [Conticribra weissflogii]
MYPQDHQFQSKRKSINSFLIPDTDTTILEPRSKRQQSSLGCSVTARHHLISRFEPEIENTTFKGTCSFRRTKAAFAADHNANNGNAE